MRQSFPHLLPIQRPGAMRRPRSKMLAAACGLLGVTLLAAQSPQPKAPAQHHPEHHKVRASSAPAPAPAPILPLTPPPPNWPVNDKPAPASITWDNRALRIDAANSSLQQILAQVSSETGARVEGLGGDQRIFGNYGPGDARDVLTQLLLGSGYNIVMVGDNGQGVPRHIVLSARRSGNNPMPAAARAIPQDDDDDTPDNQVDVQPEPPQPIPAPPAEVPGGAPPRTPQQLMEEMQQRQQQIQQQQGQQPNP